MSPAEWLRLVVAYMPCEPEQRELRRLGRQAERLTVEFPAGALTAETAAKVGRGLAVAHYPAVAEALRGAMPAPAAVSQVDRSSDAAMAERWVLDAARRLREGANPAHLLSLVRQQVPPAYLAGVMARVFPAEHARAEAEAAERAHDKARQAEAIVRRVRQAAAPPAGPRGPSPHARPQPEVVRPPASLRQRRAELARLLRTYEAAAAAGHAPVGSASRMAHLRLHLAALDADNPDPEESEPCGAIPEAWRAGALLQRCTG